MSNMISREQMQKAIKEAQRKKKREIAQTRPMKSELYDPYYGRRGAGRGIMDFRRRMSAHILRRISEKAWLINTIISHIQDKTVPYLRPADGKYPRGFSIVMKDRDAKPTEENKKRIKELTKFFLNMGWDTDRERPKLADYAKMIIRDCYNLDQINSELQRFRDGSLYAVWPVDAGTIAKCTEEGYNGDDRIRYVQLIHESVVSEYTDRDLIFQITNPRTDVMVNGYGYSKTEQAIELVLAQINTFAYNQGIFTEDRLPRGMILLNGDTGLEEVEMIEDYLIDVMSSPDGINGHWSIPIVPSGTSGGQGKSIEWVNFNNSNRDMEFGKWYDELKAGLCALYGVDMESIGLKTDKSANIIDSGSQESRRYSDDKAIGTTLSFLEDHFNRIMDELDPDYRFIFEGFEQDDAKDQRDAIDMELKTMKSINEVRAEKDLPPIDAEWADIVGINSPQVTQIYLALKQQAQQGEEGGTPEDSGTEETEVPPEEEQPENNVEEDEDFWKSLPVEEKTIVIEV